MPNDNHGGYFDGDFQPPTTYRQIQGLYDRIRDLELRIVELEAMLKDACSSPREPGPLLAPGDR